MELGLHFHATRTGAVVALRCLPRRELCTCHFSFVSSSCLFFFFNDTATTEIYTLSLHDALPILSNSDRVRANPRVRGPKATLSYRSEEHTSELQSRLHLVCRLLLEKKKTRN